MPFYLKSPTSLTDTLIIMSYHFDGKRLVFSTGEHVSPDHWNPEKQRPRASAPHSAVLKKYLDRLDNRVRELHLDLKSQFIQVTPDALRQAIIRDIRTDGKKENLVQFFTRWMGESTRKPQSNGAYNSALKLLTAYRGGGKEFADITPLWFEKYQSYMERDGYSANYIGKNVGIIREAMAAAGKQGLHRNEQYKDKEYTLPRGEVDSVYLTADDLSLISGCILPPNLDRVRDRLLISCYSGLRFSDNLTLTPDSIKDGVIHNRNIKTGAVVAIPLHPVVKRIFEKYPAGLPVSVSNKQANLSIKKIGKLAGVNTPVEITRTEGGKTVRTTVPKYELMCTHTGRRTFSSNAILAGIPTKSVMLITGHKTESSFMRYVKISQDENAEALKGHSFFTNKA